MNRMNSSAAISQKKEMSIASCLEAILERTSRSDFEPDAESGGEEEKSLQEEYDYIREKLELSEVEAELFAAIIELSISGEASSENIARRLGMSNLRFISFRPEIDALVEKRYVRSVKHGFKGTCYTVPDEVIKAIQRGERPNGEDISNLSTTGIVRKMNGRFRDYWRDDISFDTLCVEIFDILRFNMENSFVKEVIAKGINEMPRCEQILFFFMVVRRCAFSEGEFGWDDFGKLFIDSYDEDMMHAGMESGDLALIEKGIIEHANHEGIVDNTKLVFNEEAINSILSDMCGGPDAEATCKNLIGSSTIQGKQMFYNSEEEKQVKTLAELLQQENYLKVVERLKEKGFRSGFCCLFHGTPGTGKTQTAYELARMTGRDIYLVDVSQLKSKWVGDSEKNVHALFQEYKRLARNCEKAPILLFNEADAIFGIRKSGAESAVEKMENSLQNIILQEMESLEGILIATTNLTENLDKAFERRFLFKINFRKPSVEARAHIWESMVEGLEHSCAEALAKDFDFSGGQIENISRKATVDYILSGNQPGLDGLRELCKCETIAGKKKENTRIGF